MTIKKILTLFAIFTILATSLPAFASAGSDEDLDAEKSSSKVTSKPPVAITSDDEEEVFSSEPSGEYPEMETSEEEE